MVCLKLGSIHNALRRGLNESRDDKTKDAHQGKGNHGIRWFNLSEIIS